MRVVVVLGTPDGTGAHRMAETLVLSLVRGGHEAVFLTDTGPLGPEVRDRAQGALDGLRGCGVEVEHGHVSRRTILRVARRLGGEVVLVGDIEFLDDTRNYELGDNQLFADRLVEVEPGYAVE